MIVQGFEFSVLLREAQNTVCIFAERKSAEDAKTCARARHLVMNPG